MEQEQNIITMKVTIVEDEAINVVYLKTLLKKSGYKVLNVYISGEEAINKVFDDKPDVILMDIFLAGELDGVETVKKIHEVKYIPVIYVTASTDEKTFIRAKNTKNLGYIIKPFTPEQLLSCLDKIKPINP